MYGCSVASLQPQTQPPPEQKAIFCSQSLELRVHYFFVLFTNELLFESCLVQLRQKKEKQVLRRDGLLAGIPFQHRFVFFHSFQMSTEGKDHTRINIKDILKVIVQESVQSKTFNFKR